MTPDQCRRDLLATCDGSLGAKPDAWWARRWGVRLEVVRAVRQGLAVHELMAREEAWGRWPRRRRK